MKYILVALGVLLLIIFVVVIAVGGGNDAPSSREVKRLTEYASETSTEAVYTEAGAINAEENHRIIEITVSSSERTVAVLDGYDGNVQSEKTYPNSTAAFEAFLAAVEQVGFSNDRRSTQSFESVCPTGRRFSYALTSGEDEVVNTWSATCDKGTFGGNTNQTQRLFRAQIPEFQDFTGDVSFSL
jgi:hypothetical protein